jgi:hypothetical protein
MVAIPEPHAAACRAQNLKALDNHPGGRILSLPPLLTSTNDGRARLPRLVFVLAIAFLEKLGRSNLHFVGCAAQDATALPQQVRVHPKHNGQF